MEKPEGKKSNFFRPYSDKVAPILNKRGKDLSLLVEYIQNKNNMRQHISITEQNGVFVISAKPKYQEEKSKVTK